MNNNSKPFLACALAAFVITGSLSFKPVYAGDATAGFIGGVVTSKILNNMSRRTRAEEHRAYSSAPPQQSAPPAPAPVVQQPTPAPIKTPQQRFDQLDTLAAGGYITKEEYKIKKQQIIDSM